MKYFNGLILLIQYDDRIPRISKLFLEKTTDSLMTKPEIEMLMIHTLGLYEDFHRTAFQSSQKFVKFHQLHS